MRWKDWAGYYAVCSYDTTQDAEYFAFRHSAGLIDVSPLYKYDVSGKDAAAFLSRLTVRDVTKLKPGRVTYLCWLDDDGKMIDDGTVSNLGDGRYRVTAAEPSLSWLQRFTRRYDVRVEDVSTKVASLSLQGPNSRGILQSCVEGADVAALKFFGITKGRLAGLDVLVSRTGYTGDLGYEVWTDAGNAEALYDALMKAGKPFAILPAGLDAMDVTRIEAGFIMNGVDYFSAHHCLTDERKSSPFEIGLGWTVEMERPEGQLFVGQEALKREIARGPEWQLVGLEVDWVETENLFASYGLPPEVCNKAWRDGKPVYDVAGNWVGMATSGAWSPILKKNLALAQVRAPYGKEGQKLKIEQTAEFRRHTVTATVQKTPFYNPPRKRS
jgi:aminomethyltransferase